MFSSIFDLRGLIDDIDNCLDWYDRKGCSLLSYKLFLCNGDVLRTHYDIATIPHLLGVNIDTLRSTGFYTGSAYNILDDIISNPERLYSQFKNGILNEERVFSPYVKRKVRNFRNVCTIHLNSLLFIVKYDRNNSYITGEEKLDGDYYIVSRTDSDTLSVVGFVKNGNIYSPLTNIELDENSYEDQKYLNRLLKNQVITTVQTLKREVSCEDNYKNKPYYYSYDEKLRKFKTMEYYASEYGCHIATNKDCVFYLEKVIQNSEDRMEMWQVLKEVVLAITSNKMVDLRELEKKYDSISPSVVDLISSYNDSLVSDKGEGNNSYKGIIESLNKKKKEVLSLKEKLNSESSRILELEEKVRLLENENSSYKSKIEDIGRVLERK